MMQSMRIGLDSPVAWPARVREASSLPRAWLWFALSLVSLFLVTELAGLHSSHIPALHEGIAYAKTFAFRLPLSSSSSSSDVSSSPGSDSANCAPSQCQIDPFSSPGFLTSSPTNLSENRWNPLELGCTTPQLSESVRQRDPSLDWMRGRTIVVFGDSVERFYFEDFCKIIDGNATVILLNSVLSPPNVEPSWHVASDRATWRLSRICEIVEYDFVMVFTFQYGVNDEDFFRHSTPAKFNPPGLLEDRLNLLLLPLLKNLQRPGGMLPDLVTISAFEWDTIYWTGQKRYAQPPFADVVDGTLERTPESELLIYNDVLSSFFPTFVSRLAVAAQAIHEAFPISSRIIWRMPHDVSSRGALLAQLAQLIEQATRSVLGGKEWVEFYEIGPMSRGSWGGSWMRDTIHLGKVPYSYVWNDYMLFKLRVAVTGE